MRLIDGDVLYEQTAEWANRSLNAVVKTMNDEDKTEWQKWSTINAERSAFLLDIAYAPTVDAVPVVRCKDCRWWKTNYTWNGKEVRVCVIEPYEPCRKPDDYCSKGERKGGDE